MANLLRHALNHIRHQKGIPRESQFHAPGIIHRNMDGSFIEENFISPGILCFCDIPADDLSIHTSKYGFFGLSFPRQFLIERGARPVIYMPHYSGDTLSIHGRQLLADIENIYKGFRSLAVDVIAGAKAKRSRSFTAIPKTRDDAIVEISQCLEKDFFSYVKAFDINLPEEDPLNYYMEREWRTFLSIRFQFSDLSRVFVAPGFEGRLKADVQDYLGTVTVLSVSS